MRWDQRNLTLAAMSAVALLLAALFLLDFLGYMRGDVFNVSPAMRYFRVLAFGAASALASAMVYFCWRGHDIATRIAVLALPFGLPFVFDPHAFDYSVPQGVWIPFLMALATCGLRWALLTAAVSVFAVAMTYPNAFNSATMVGTSLIIAVLASASTLIQQALVRKALDAKEWAQQSEVGLRESEMKYRKLIEQSPLAIQVFSPEGTALRVNHAWEALWNTPFAALSQYNLFEDRQLAEHGILPLLEKAFEGECVQLPIHQYDKAKATEVPNSGGTLWIRAFAYPLHGADGTLREVAVIQEDVTESVLAEEQIHNLAYFDPLTQLPNRRLLMDRLGQALISSNRNKEFGALLILDLDHFKSLNDTQGHDIGDLLLVEVAKRLTTAIRSEDTVSRLGGDEYVVVLERLGQNEHAAAGEAEQIAEKVLGIITQRYALQADNIKYHCTSSIGLTLFRGQDVSPETLLKQADVALYQAKDAGRNAIRFFNPEMQAAIDARIAMENALRLALARDEFQLFYQPQVNQVGDMIGVEALLRWLHPSQGLVTPERFISLTEKTGLIVPIGKWVLNRACTQIKSWEDDARTRHLPISVNVSAQQFHQRDFVAQVQQSIQANGANPSRLKLELTESVILNDVDKIIGKLQELDDMGIGFSLDDFGTGYSSLSYLKRLPFKQLKIAQSFVRDIDQDPNDAAIVRAILAMSQTLGIQAIAEGVETVEQRDFLHQNGCLAFQGFLFGKPMQIAEFESMLPKISP